MMSKESYKMDMCNGPVLQKVIAFSLPLMLSSCLQLLFNAADVIVVGRFAGSTSLAAVGSTTELLSLLTTLFIGFSIGAQCKCGTNPWKPGRSGNERRRPHSHQCQYFIWIYHDSIGIFIWSTNAPMDGDSCRCH